MLGEKRNEKKWGGLPRIYKDHRRQASAILAFAGIKRGKIYVYERMNGVVSVVSLFWRIK